MSIEKAKELLREAKLYVTPHAAVENKIDQALAELSKQSKPSEFTKELRKICSEERKESSPYIAVELVVEACDIIEHLTAENAELKAERFSGGFDVADLYDE